MHGSRVREGGSGMTGMELTLPGSNAVTVFESYNENFEDTVDKTQAGFKILLGLFRTFESSMRGIMWDVSQSIEETGDAIVNAMKKPEKKVNLLASGFKKLGGVLLDVQNIQKGMEIADKYLNTSYRLNQANIDKVDNRTFQDSVFQSANRSRVSYDAMANSMANLGSGAKGSFANNNELIAFTELAYKSFGGAGEQGQQTGVDTLIQAMSSGGLKGSELSNLAKTSPALTSALEGYTGKSQEELMNMADQGLITAEVIKNAMFKSSESINKEFGENVPRTFADVFDEIKNRSLMSFAPAIEHIGTILKSPGFEQFIGSVMFVISIVSALFADVVNTLDFIFSIWGALEPILLSLGILLAIWGVQQLLVINQLPLLVGRLWLAAQGVWAAAMGWLMQNLVLATILVAIGLLIYAMLKFGDTVVSIFGIIGGAIGVLLASLYNIFIAGLWNALLWLIAAIGNMFIEKINTWIDRINWIIRIINTVKQTKISEIDNVNLIDFSGIQLKYKNMDDAYKTGQGLGEKAGTAIVDFAQEWAGKLSAFGKAGEDPMKNLNPDNYMENGAMPVTPKDGSLNVDMSGEDLKYLKDIAEREYINQYSTATLAPSLNVSFGNVTKEADVDKLVGRIQKILNEELAVVSEGVY